MGTGDADIYQHAAYSKCLPDTHIVRQVLLSACPMHSVVAGLVQGLAAGWRQRGFLPTVWPLLWAGQSRREAVLPRGHTADQRQTLQVS